MFVVVWLVRGVGWQGLTDGQAPCQLEPLFRFDQRAGLDPGRDQGPLAGVEDPHGPAPVCRAWDTRTVG